MAAQCGPFVSSSVYHGYVQTPAALSNAQLMQQQQQTNNNQNQQQHNGMEVDSDTPQKNQFHQAMITAAAEAAAAEAQEQRSRKRGFDALPQDFDYEAYVVPRLKKFREEAVVTNVFSMVQGTGSGPHQINMDWPRCTMSRYYA